jgi:AcrR family transcriptional regulator
MTEETPAARPGRWRSGAESRQRILDAAGTLFAERGYGGTSVRAVAAQAGVDPAMVYYFFNTKQGLFTATLEMSPKISPAFESIFQGDLDGIGERIVRALLEAMDTSDRVPFAILTRAVPTSDQSELMLREFVDRELTSRLIAMLDEPDAAMRVAMVNTYIMGLAVARYVVKLDPIATAPVDELVARIGPSLQQFLTGASPPS